MRTRNKNYSISFAPSHKSFLIDINGHEHSLVGKIGRHTICKAVNVGRHAVIAGGESNDGSRVSNLAELCDSDRRPL